MDVVAEKRLRSWRCVSRLSGMRLGRPRLPAEAFFIVPSLGFQNQACIVAARSAVPSPTLHSTRALGATPTIAVSPGAFSFPGPRPNGLAASSPLAVEALARLRQHDPGTFQPGAPPVQRGQGFSPLDVQEDVGLADELNLTGDSERKLVETAHARKLQLRSWDFSSGGTARV